ncbi:hypothetical protein EDD86DRAFT_186916 [Gorgonomyces haynaldii]|nr:hypothetical protein EDD86DRAFT_186916 [Gorgonomyces haynaldii]
MLHLLVQGVLSQCLTLDKSTDCGGDYEDYPVSLTSYPTIANFSAQLKSLVGDLNQVSTSLSVGGAKCNGPNIRTAVNGLRFQESIFCSIEVNSAIASGCKVPANRPAKGPLLCPASCNAAVQSLKTLFADPTACPVNSAVNARAQLIARFQSYCDSALALMPSNFANGSPNACTNGAVTETSLCGWREQSLAQSGCSNFASDKCCQSIVAAQPANNVPMIIGVVAGVLFLVIAVAGFVFYARRKRQQRDTENTSYRPYNLKNEPSDAQLYLRKDQELTPSYDKPEQGYKTPSIVAPQQQPASANPLLDASAPVDMNNLPDGAEKMTVIHNYVPTLNDELKLEIGTTIVMLYKFDDGWALGYDPATQLKGAFPLVCVQAQKRMSVANKRESYVPNKRVSSMLIATLDRNPFKSSDADNAPAPVTLIDVETSRVSVPKPSAMGLPSSEVASPMVEKPKKTKSSHVSRYIAELDSYDPSLDAGLPEAESPVKINSPSALENLKVETPHLDRPEIANLAIPSPLHLEEEFGKK